MATRKVRVVILVLNAFFRMNSRQHSFPEMYMTHNFSDEMGITFDFNISTLIFQRRYISIRKRNSSVTCHVTKTVFKLRDNDDS